MKKNKCNPEIYKNVPDNVILHDQLPDDDIKKNNSEIDRTIPGTRIFEDKLPVCPNECDII